jgi:hypothetical protein
VDIEAFLNEKNEWSLKTFGEGERTEGIIAHIESELVEVRETPRDVYEWVDIIFLAMDGAYRNGFEAQDLIYAMEKKHEINKTRSWPVAEPDKPSFHTKDN